MRIDILENSVMRTYREKIVAKIRRAPRGTLFSLKDFNFAGDYEAVKSVVLQLVKEGILVNVYSGIYQKPNYSEFLKTNVAASPREIAEKYAQKNQWEIAPAGVMALNILGLDTQVPNTYHHISDGPTREIVLKNGKKIRYRHVQEKDMKMNQTSSLVVEAMKQLGKENITNEDLAKIRVKFNNEQLKQLKRDSAHTRVWIRDMVRRMEELNV
jgi:hypothetical protein